MIDVSHLSGYCVCLQNLLPSSFTSQCLLRELHMEENRLRDLAYFQSLRNLERLYLGMNRIQVAELGIV